MSSPESFVGKMITYPGNDTSIITKVSYVTGYPENFEPYYSVYTKNESGEEKWIVNLPRSDFTDNNPIFMTSYTYNYNKQAHNYIHSKNINHQKKDCEDINNECPICYKTLCKQDAYVTSCNHTFCQKCIIQISKKNVTYNCPLCRNKCTELKEALKNVTTLELYEIYCDAVNSEDSRQLCVTEDLLNIIGYILTTDEDKRLKKYLLEESNDEDFKFVYEDCIVKGNKHFIRVNDPIRQFALTLLFYKYH